MISIYFKLGLNRLNRIINEILNKDSLPLKPNFLIPGVARAGTTALYYYLKQHPEIYFSKIKEPHFFTRNYELGENWYLSHFKSIKKFPAVGEASVSYFGSEIVIKRIYKFNPDFKLIFIMRDPVERLYSSYKFTVYLRGKNLSFENFISNQLTDCKYYTIINRFLKYFSKNNMFFLIFEKFIKDPFKYLKEICEFLDINSKFKFDHNKIYHNSSKMPMSLSLQQKNYKYFGTDRRRREHLLKQSVKSGIYEFITLLNCFSKSRKFPDMKENTIISLKKNFEEDVSNLEKLINIELDEWKED